MNRLLIILFLLLFSVTGHTVTRTWPGAAPCNSSLQACIDGSAANDTILVASNGPIDESLVINKSLVLKAAPGFRPALAPARSISSQFNAFNLTIEGFRLTDGSINLAVDGAAVTTIRNNRLSASAGGPGGRIRVHKASVNGSLNVDVSNNVIDRLAALPADSAIEVISSAVTTGLVAFNRIRATGPGEGKGINLDIGPSHASDIKAFANRIEGRFDAGAIRLTSQQALSTGGVTTQTMRAISNVVICPGATQGFPSGIVFETYFAAGYQLRLFNNTVVGCGGDPIAVNQTVTGANVSGNIVNNLVAFNRYSVVVSGNYLDDFTIHRNLSHGNTFNAMPAGSTATITANPVLFSRSMPRLESGSPAINAGDAVAAQLEYAAAGLPHVDADGRRRNIGVGTTAIDIGAFEFGDRYSLARKTSPSGTNNMALGYAGEPNLRLQITKLYNPVSGEPEVENAAPAGVFELGEWFGYAIGAVLPQNAWLNVFAPGPQGSFNASYLHTTTVDNVNLSETWLSQGYLNSRLPDQAIVLATPVWLGGNQNPQHVAVGYRCDPLGSPGANCWIVTNQSLGANMPTGFGFNIYAQDRSPNAFVHRVEGPASGYSSLAYHHILGNDPHRCARPLATPRLGTLNNSAFDFDYSSDGSWRLFNYAGAFPAGSEFNIFVDQRAFEECVLKSQDQIFSDRFQ